MSPLPGVNEDVSGAIIAGYNIGIDGSIPKEKLDASIIAFKFLSSKEIQRKYFLIENLVSGINSLYDDKDICERIDCEAIKKVQFINRPVSPYHQYSDYYSRIEDFVYQYLYGDALIDDVLEKVEDLTRIYYLSINKKNENNELALSIFMLVVTASFIMGGSLLLLYSKKYKIFFCYMNKDSWIISVLGLIIVISNCYTTFGLVTKEKCILYIQLLSLGYTLNLLPIIYQLIINYPEENKLFNWIKQHKYLFFTSVLLSVILILSLFFINTFTVELIMIDGGKNFETCKIKNSFGIILVLLLLLYYLFYIFVILVLCYAEWGHRTIIYDIHIYVTAIYIDIFSILLLFILNFISFKHYILQFLIKNIFIILPVISNYITMYGFRLYLPFYNLKNFDRDVFRMDSDPTSMQNTTSNFDSNNKMYNKDSNTRSRQFILKLRDYHNQSMDIQSTNSYINTSFTNETSKHINTFSSMS